MRLTNSLLFLRNYINNDRLIFLYVKNDQRRNYSIQKLVILKDSLHLNKIKELRDQVQLKLKDSKISLESREQVLQRLSKKGTEINNWYMKAIGLDQVKLLQDRVVTMQAALSKAQEVRRDYDTQLKEKRVHLNKIQEQINKINRYQDSSSGLKYMELIQDEMKEISLEKELSIKFEEADKRERELFAAFCIAIRDSHDKERSQAEYTKYFGIILSIIGTIVGSMLTLIINSVRTRDLLAGIEEVVDNQMLLKDEKIDELNIDVRKLDLNIRNLADKITTFQNEIPKLNSSTTVTHLPEVREEQIPVFSDKIAVFGLITASFIVFKLFGL